MADLKISTPEYAWTLLKDFYPDLTLHKASLKHPREESQAQNTAKYVLGELPLPIKNLSQFTLKAEKIVSLPQVRYWLSRRPRFHYNPDILFHQIFMDGLTMQPERSAKSMRSLGVQGDPPAPSPCKLANAKVGTLSPPAPVPTQVHALSARSTTGRTSTERRSLCLRARRIWHASGFPAHDVELFTSSEGGLRGLE